MPGLNLIPAVLAAIDGGANLFRGPWGPDTLARTYDWSSGLPPEFTATKVGNDALAPVPVALTNEPYTTAVKLDCNWMYTNLQSSTLTLDLKATGLSNLTRVVTTWKKPGGADAQYFRERILRDGTPVYDQNNRASWSWETREMSIATASTAAWVQTGGAAVSGTRYADVWIARIALYVGGEPYMINQYVTHDGMLWRSEIDNNTDRPGTTANWKPVVASGATRPALAMAGPGYQFFDTTLNKPIWSNATATGWVDATGAAVV